MSINLWQYQGIVNSVPGSGQPNVLFESAKLLSGIVFKMWYSTPAGINYAESVDGASWTQHPSNPIQPLSSYPFVKLSKVSGTYYFSVQNETGNLDIYSSPDGIALTLAKENAVIQGSSGAWDNALLYQLVVIDVVSGTWYGYYTSSNYTDPLSGKQTYAMGLVTSADGLNWTKSPANPIITQFGPSNFWFIKIAASYYGWSQGILPQLLPNESSPSIPSDIFRYTSSSPAGPFTSNGVPAYVRSQVDTEGVGLTVGQVGDPSLVSDGLNLWMFYTATPDSSTTTYQIAAAKIPNKTFSQLVGNPYEGNRDIPFPFFSPNELKQTAADAFTRSDANPLSGSWASVTGLPTAQLVSGLVEGTNPGSNSDMYYTGADGPGADQWARITVKACSSAYVGVSLRNAASSWTAYRIYWNGTLGTSGSLVIQKVLNGSTFDQLTETNVILNVDDVLTASVIDGTLAAYVNGDLVATAADADIADGSAGFAIAPISTIESAAITNFQAGSVGNPVSASGAYLGRVRVVASAPAAKPNPYLGMLIVVDSAPAGGADPYLGQVVEVDSAPDASNPSIGTVTVVGSAPAGDADPFLGSVKNS